MRIQLFPFWIFQDYFLPSVKPSGSTVQRRAQWGQNTSSGALFGGEGWLRYFDWHFAALIRKWEGSPRGHSRDFRQEGGGPWVLASLHWLTPCFSSSRRGLCEVTMTDWRFEVTFGGHLTNRSQRCFLMIEVKTRQNKVQPPDSWALLLIGSGKSQRKATKDMKILLKRVTLSKKQEFPAILPHEEHSFW